MRFVAAAVILVALAFPAAADEAKPADKPASQPSEAVLAFGTRPSRLSGMERRLRDLRARRRRRELLDAGHRLPAGRIALQAAAEIGMSQPPFAHEPDLHDMGQHRIGEQDQRDQRPIERGQRNEAERGAEPAVGQPDSHHADDQRGRQQRRAGAALDEGDLAGADDVDDQRLGQQGFDEPAGLEQGRIGPRAEHEQHHAIGDIVEDRADRPDIDHELEDVADVPAARLDARNSSSTLSVGIAVCENRRAGCW